MLKNLFAPFIVAEMIYQRVYMAGNHKEAEKDNYRHGQSHPFRWLVLDKFMGTFFSKIVIRYDQLDGRY